ncbi:MAG: SRPBCC family protein [Acidimicrobiia bacterium]
MRISREFQVRRPLEEVWSIFDDVPAVASCLPGAEILEDLGNGKYMGRIQTRLGPIRTNFEGTAAVQSDISDRSGRIEGEGVDRKGGSRGKVVVEYSLRETDRETSITVDADVALSGAAAQFGRSAIIEELTTQIIDEFVSCLEGTLDSGNDGSSGFQQQPTVSLGVLLIRSIRAWLRKLFSRS